MTSSGVIHAGVPDGNPSARTRAGATEDGLLGSRMGKGAARTSKKIFRQRRGEAYSRPWLSRSRPSSTSLTCSCG
jgi:hypothetical protein